MSCNCDNKQNQGKYADAIKPAIWFFKAVLAAFSLLFIVYKYRGKLRRWLQNASDAKTPLSGKATKAIQAINKVDELVDKAETKIGEYANSIGNELGYSDSGSAGPSTKKQDVDKMVKTKVGAAVNTNKEDSELKSNKSSDKKESKSKNAGNSPFNLNDRQEAIYNLIQSEGSVNMGDISRVVAGVTKRTLRRDTTKLEKLGLIEQVGKTKDASYKIRK